MFFIPVMLAAILLGTWCHSLSHYLYARYVLKLDCQVNLGLRLWGAKSSETSGIRFGWLFFISRFQILPNRASAVPGRKFKILSTFLFGILASLVLGFGFGLVGYLTTPGKIDLGRTIRKGPVVVGEVLTGWPASQIGIKPMDKIIKVNEKPIQRFEDLQEAIIKSTGTVQIKILRAGKEMLFTVAPRDTTDGNRIIGLSPKPPKLVYQSYSFSEASKLSLKLIPNHLKQIKIFLTSLPQKNLKSKPLRIELDHKKKQPISTSFFLVYLANVLTFFGIYNLIPFPPFDMGNAIFRSLSVSQQKLGLLKIFGILIIFYFVFWGIWEAILGSF